MQDQVLKLEFLSLNSAGFSFLNGALVSCLEQDMWLKQALM